MYVVLVNHKSREAMTDLMAELIKKFPNERFTVEGSEEQGYKFRIEGAGDEKPPRAVAKVFLKTWKPKPVEAPIEIINAPVASVPAKKTIKVSMPNIDDMLSTILPK